MRPSLIERFWAKVERGDGCWLWGGFRDKNGYGQCKVAGHVMRAHRCAWMLAYGAFPLPGILVCHHCDTPSCVRPDHLFLSTPLGNMRDAVAKGRMATGEGHGTRLHPGSVPRGVQRRGVKLTEAAVRAIRARYRAGAATQRALAVEYGVSYSLVSLVVKRKTWDHVAEEAAP